MCIVRSQGDNKHARNSDRTADPVKNRDEILPQTLRKPEKEKADGYPRQTHRSDIKDLTSVVSLPQILCQDKGPRKLEKPYLFCYRAGVVWDVVPTGAIAMTGCDTCYSNIAYSC